MLDLSIVLLIRHGDFQLADEVGVFRYDLAELLILLIHALLMAKTSGRMPILFGMTLFLSAFLLFFVQPMASKAMLPSFGGSHSVWNTSLFFYTAVLLCGYLYAHILSRLNRSRLEAVIHFGLILIVAILLYSSTSDSFMFPSSDHPIVGLLLLLTRLVGLPLLLFSTTSPLLQVWYARTGHHNPYPLYIVSNAGSFVAIVLYPVLEYFTPLSTHFMVWKAVSLIFLVFLVLCLWLYIKPLAEQDRGIREDLSPGKRLLPQATIKRKLIWVFLAFLPALLLPATTTYSFKGIAPSPIFWLIPLLLYILSFMIGFSARQYDSRLRGLLNLILVAVILAIVVRAATLASLLLYSNLITGPLLLFLTAILCHRQLYLLRPDTRQLTLFYLIISIGGVLGNLFVGIIAPLVFTAYHELYIGLGLAAVTIILLRFDTSRYPLQAAALSAQVFLLCALPALFHPAQGKEIDNLRQMRSFYGTITVYDTAYTDRLENAVSQPARLLVSDMTLHGGQYLDKEDALIPFLYYNAAQPISAVFAAAQQHRPASPLKVAIAGLGSGALAAYCRPGDRFDFYEINEQMRQVAREDFTYLNHCEQAQVIMGDARLMLAEGEKQAATEYDLIILDAFSDDAIPMHLLTLEALDLYLRRSSSDGALIFHISNRYLDLKPQIVALAKARDIEPMVLHKDFSLWVLLPLGEHWRETQLLEEYIRSSDSVKSIAPWTDDYHSVLHLL